MGGGATMCVIAIQWGFAGRIVAAWILTIPCAAVVAAVSYEIVRIVQILSP